MPRLNKKRILMALAPIAGVSWIIVDGGCSQGDSVVGYGGPSSPASKPVAATFQADKSTDYDPLAGMTEDQRKAAIGGSSDALDYFKLVASHLARAMKNPSSRAILHKAVPSWDQGEAKLAEIAVDYPDLLRVLSAGLRDSVQSKGFQNDLAANLRGASSDEEAMLRVAEALFDLEIVLAIPPGEDWDVSDEIPIFFDPIVSGASVIEGVDSDLNSISLSADITEVPYPLLAINFDEDAPLSSDGQTTYQSPLPLDGLWNFSLMALAYADDPPNHFECYDENLMQPAKEITIYVDHDPGPWNKPEIWVSFSWDTGNIIGPDEFDLKKVDKVNVKYTRYHGERTTHGQCGNTDRMNIRVWEDDVWYDDEMAYWEEYNVWALHEEEESGQVKLMFGKTNEDK